MGSGEHTDEDAVERPAAEHSPRAPADATQADGTQADVTPADITPADLTERVMRVAHLIRRAAMSTLAPLNLTPAQSRALRTISRAAAPIRMGELAAMLGVVPRSATGLVDALESAGVVERTVDPDNRRAVLVRLTPRGQAVQQQMSDARAAAGAGIFEPLNDGERRQLAELLARVGT